MKLNTVLYLFIVLECCKAAVVQISTPNAAVELGSSVEFEVKEMLPNASSPWFDRLDCALISPTDPVHKNNVAQYDTHAMKFKAPSLGIHKEYQKRVSYVGHMSFKLERIQFGDKLLKVVCVLSYKNGSLTRHVESNVYEIKMVYVSPIFHYNSTQEGNVTMRQGQTTTIQCVAKSFPQSDIYWVTSIGKNAYHSERSRSQQKREFTTKSTFILHSPISDYDGKNVDCIVKPKHGRTIRRRFTLSYKYEEKKKKKNEECTIYFYSTIALAVILGVLALIAIFYGIVKKVKHSKETSTKKGWEVKLGL